MKLSLYEICRKKRMTAGVVAIMIAVAFLYAAVCMPVFIWAKSDVLLADSIFLVVWELVSTAVNYLFYWVSFSFMLYFAARFTLQNSKSFLGGYVGACAVMYLVSLISSGVINGVTAFSLRDIGDVVMYVGFDAALMAIAVLVTQKMLGREQENVACEYGIQKLNDADDLTILPQHLPFTSFFNFKNKLMKTLFWIILIPSAWHILSRLYYDIFFFGIPVDAVDLLWMIFYYVSEVITFFVGYFFSIFVLNFIFAREERKRAHYKEAIKHSTEQ